MLRYFVGFDRLLYGSLLALLLLPSGTGISLAAEKLDPLRLVPDVADLVLKIEQPRRVIDLALGLIDRPELQGFRGYRDAMNGTDLGRFKQLIAHLEKELGKPWPELVDHLASGGIVVAAKIEKPPGGVFVMQGDDQELTTKFFAKIVEITNEERARLGQPGEYGTAKYRGIDGWQLQKDVYASVLDSALVYTSSRDALKAVIDLHLDASDKKAPNKNAVSKNILNSDRFQKGQNLRPEKSLAWAWIDVDYLKKSPEAKTLFTYPSNFFPIPLALGGLLDVLYRSPFVMAAVTEEANGPAFSVRLPAGLSEMRDVVKGHVPPNGERGTLPLLAPQGVIYCNSFYLDFGHFWKERKQLLPADQLANAETFNDASAAFLSGTKFGDLLQQAGTRHRIVVTVPRESPYTTQPVTRYPNVAWVWQLRDPAAFDKSLSGPLQAAAVLAGFQAPMKKVEEQIGDVKLVGYKFLENDKNKSRDNGILFNFTPCFARVNDQFILSSSLELGRDLIPLLVEEPKTNAFHFSGVPLRNGTGIGTITPLVDSRFHWTGLTQYLSGIKKTLVTQNMLEQGNDPTEAEREVSLYLNLLEKLTPVELSTAASEDRYWIGLGPVATRPENPTNPK